MRRTRQFLLRMALFLVLVAAFAFALHRPLLAAFLGNPAVNGVILGILLAGIIYIFRQVMLLDPEVEWIESFRRRLADRDFGAPSGRPPRLLAPMARMLGARRDGRVSLSASSLQTLLDGIASRLDETRETSRYLIGLLVFLGLLGTFYGLLETVRSVGGVIGALDVTASDVARAFADLKAGLESPLHGMATAFSSSLFGLASTHTRLSSGSLAEAGEGSVPAYLQALLEQTADSLESLQRLLTRSEENRIASNTTLASLAERLGTIGEHMNAGQGQMIRFAESSLGQNEAVRTHLRAIEGYMARLNEELAEGRAQSVAELRNEIRLLARTIAALADESGR
ncbi:MAG: hypothetical protein AUG47_01320 [Alphaproteobacteria bacterium 13_1_20CM_3_64_12]|nr:MAG: hypothetical protein AUG47_01320 [Alphaproteobacteria bacterium 13_1_20CM_3_64_12]